MECDKCGYQYCFACGASATNEERHYDKYRGCGADSTDRLLKPAFYNQSAKNRLIYKCPKVLIVPILVLFLPVTLVMILPYLFMKMCLAKHEKDNCCLKVWVCILATILGWILTPLFLLFYGLFYCQVVAFCMIPPCLCWLCTCKCCFIFVNNKKAARRNEIDARRKMGWSAPDDSDYEEWRR